MNVFSQNLKDWVEEIVQLCCPDQVHWCDGSEEERDILTRQAVQTGELIPFDQDLLPNCFLHRSDPTDCARMELRTFICSPKEQDAGPTNNWMNPQKAYGIGKKLFKNSMKGKTMYIVPFCMGHLESDFKKISVEITDSIYVVLNMRLMTTMGVDVLNVLNDSTDFTKCVHSVGDLNPEKRYVFHFPEDNTIWSLYSGYGGNVLLGKKCLGLRMASYWGKQEQWMAEHMLILGVERPHRGISFILGAFPSACGKTNLAMLSLMEEWKKKGYRIWTVGDDIAWLRIDSRGRLVASNPEKGFFGVLPGTNRTTNSIAMDIISRDTLYTNVLLTDDRRAWWEGLEKKPQQGYDWKGELWNTDSKTSGAHPNARFTSSLSRCSQLLKGVQEVPISAILFGSRRSKVIPLVYESFSWNHGVYLGATLLSEETSAQEHSNSHEIRRDPMAMKAFCGYNMGEYFQHWISMGKWMTHPPKIFAVNWFRKNSDGQYLWKGFSENMRVLDWILDRCDNSIEARKTSIGFVPNTKNLSYNMDDKEKENLNQVCLVDNKKFQKEVDLHEKFLQSFGKKCPESLWKEHFLFKKRLGL